MPSWLVMIIGVSFQLALLACATQESTSPAASVELENAAPAIQLDKALHFTSSDGADVIVAAGRYQVEPTVEAQLRLVLDGEKPPLVVAAVSTIYNLDVSAPVALALPIDDDTHYVMFLLPEGTALQAIGSASGTTARGLASTKLAQAKLLTALDAKTTTAPSNSKFTYRLKDALKVSPFVFKVNLNALPSNGGDFDACETIKDSVYVSSVVAQQTTIVLPLDRTKRPGTVTTHPRIPYQRMIPNSPYRCATGNVTVSASPPGPALQSGDKLRLVVTSWLDEPRFPYIGGYWVEDTYEHEVPQGTGHWSFRVVMVTAFVGTDPSAVTQNLQTALQRMPNGIGVGVEAFLNGVSYGRTACTYQFTPGYNGRGYPTCTFGTRWPVMN